MQITELARPPAPASGPFYPSLSAPGRARELAGIALLALLTLLTTCRVALAVTPLPQGDPDYDDADRHIFRDGELTHIDVTMDPADLEFLLANPWGDEYKICTVQITNSVTNETIHQVGIRVRGNYSRNGIKKSWKLSFNTFVPGRKFHGLEKLNVNGVLNDPSIIRHKLASDLFNRMNVPSSRAHHVSLEINDGAHVEGVYILVEHIDEQLVGAWFGNNGGNLYKCLRMNDGVPDLRYIPPGTPETYRNLGGGETYVETLHENPDYTDLADFIHFINQTDEATFAAGINQWFNVDNFLRVLAVDATIGNWDDFWFGQNNYYLYHDQETGRFEFIPYDLDNTYGIDFPHVNWALRPHDTWGGGQEYWPPLVLRILAIPAYEEQYRRYLRLMTGPAGPFTLEYTDSEIDAIHALIDPHAFLGSFSGGRMDWGYTHADFDLSYTWPTEYRDHRSGWDYGLKPFIGDRTAFLVATVPAPPDLPALAVNELMAVNRSGIQDEFGELEDWVEIRNGSGAPLDVGGMFLTDNPGNPTRWPIPAGTVIEPGGFLIIWCDNEPGEGPFHATFKLDGDGEGVGLFDSSANGAVLIDYLSFPELGPDMSYGRFPDGRSGQPIRMATPTPGSANVAGGNLAPLVGDTGHLPASPDPGGTVTVTSRLRDLDGTIAAGTLYHDAGAGFVAAQMFDDGMHGDGEASDQVYGGEIPGYAGGLTVRYYVEARDDQGSTATDPFAAPGATFSYVVDYVPPPLYVNEFMALNRTTVHDEFGQYDDWVEIYNRGSEPLDLAGLGLSDDLTIPDRFVFPAIVLPPRGFLLVWCDGEPQQGPLHTSFRLAAAGEEIGLFASADHGWAPIDTLSFGPQSEDVSYGREPDGGPVWRFYQTPTPGFANLEASAVGETSGAPRFRLALAGPNPLVGQNGTRIILGLERPGRAELRLYDVSGRLRLTLLDRPLAAGEHELAWNGRDASGRRLGAGVYFLRLESLDRSQDRRLVIAR